MNITSSLQLLNEALSRARTLLARRASNVRQRPAKMTAFTARGVEERRLLL